MHRLTARFLLTFALVGSFAPAVLAAASAPPHACCVRNAGHCHDSAASESDPLSFRGNACCNHDCCRAAATAQWAYAQPPITAFFLQTMHAHVASPSPGSPATASAEFQSTRAPPAC